MNNSINPTTRARKRYFFEFWASIAAYTVLMAVRVNFIHSGTLRHWSKGWQLALALSPALAMAGVFFAVLRFIKGMDELGRRIAADSLAVAGGVTCLLAACYGLAEGPMLPRLSAFWTVEAFMVCWVIASIIFQRRYR